MCLLLRSRGQTERSAPTDLRTAGKVEVDEIAAAHPCGQVQKPFICKSVAVSQTQVLKAEAVPVQNDQSVMRRY